MRLGELLPATAEEIAARIGRDMHQVHALLCWWRRNGWVTVTGRAVARAGRGRRFVHIYTVKPAGRDVAVLGLRFLMAEYRRVRRACAAMQWRARHAFTHMGLEPV